MLAHGFTAELLDRMVVEGVAATKRHRMRAGRRQIEVTWLMDRCHCHDRWSTSPGRLDARRKPHRGQAGRVAHTSGACPKAHAANGPMRPNIEKARRETSAPRACRPSRGVRFVIPAYAALRAIG